MILVRHGETDWNVERRIQGWKGTSLNKLGLKQAALAAGRLKRMGVVPAAILSSDLTRTVETARVIAAKFKKPILRWREWRERNFGDWEGRSVEQVLSKYKLGEGQRVDPFMAFEPHGGESMKVFEARIRRGLSKVEKRYKGKTVLVVTHGGPARIASCVVTGIPTKKYFLLGRPENSSISIIHSQGGTRWLELYNDASHLEA
jgi:broad specificity phosphatase PhoE